MTFIKESYHSNMTLAEAEKLVLQVLKNVMEERITRDNIEISVVKSDTKLLEQRNGDYKDAIIATLS
jgi:20S proteasome subunit alpha 5